MSDVNPHPPERVPYHGPLSVAGVMLGLLVAAVPFVIGVDDAVYWCCVLAGPGVGVVLVFLPGRVHQLGTGLLASGIAYPVGLTGLLVAAALLG